MRNEKQRELVDVIIKERVKLDGGSCYWNITSAI